VKKILLINPNTYDQPYPVYPLGLSYVEDALRRAGMQTRILDFNVAGTAALGPVIDEWKPDWIGVGMRNIDDVRISERTYFVDSVGEVIREIRSRTLAPVVLGGSGFSIFPKAVFEELNPDYGLVGEAEASFVALVQGEEAACIPGLVYRVEGKVVEQPVQRLAAGLIAAPLRDPELLAYYLRDGGMANLQTQRGCPLKCTYCTYPVIEGRGYRRRSAASIAREFLDLKEAGARYVFVVDSVFNTSEAHVRAVAQALIDAGSPLPWGCFMRPKGLREDLVELLKQSGLSHVEFGSDSLCDEVLQWYGKDFAFEDVLESSELLRKAAVDYCHFVIFGGPGESYATMERAYENSKRLAGALIFPSVGMRVYPNTRLHAQSMALDTSVPQRDEALLRPWFFLAPGLTQEGIRERVNRYAAESPNWVELGENPAFEAIAKRLRKKGVVGPLWNYLGALRRIR
jgi:radical SAM superfamily enzyme YgiQ (UPF0313 family)